MITEICKSCRNYFATDFKTGALFGAETGVFSLVDKNITVQGEYKAGQYIAVSGSVLNNGVYRIERVNDGVIALESDDLLDEEWSGTVYALRIPSDFLRLAKRIGDFANSDDGQAGNVVSASFGIQSVSYGTNSAGMRAGWQDVFRNDLSKYRRMFPDITL